MQMLVVSLREQSLVIKNWGAPEVGPWSKRGSRDLLILSELFLLEKVGDPLIIPLIISFVTDIVQMCFYKTDIVNWECIHVLIKAFEALNLVNLIKVHLVLDHCIPRLKDVLFAQVVVDLLAQGLSESILLDICDQRVGLKLL